MTAVFGEGFKYLMDVFVTTSRK